MLRCKANARLLCEIINDHKGYLEQNITFQHLIYLAQIHLALYEMNINSEPGTHRQANEQAAPDGNDSLHLEICSKDI